MIFPRFFHQQTIIVHDFQGFFHVFLAMFPISFHSFLPFKKLPVAGHFATPGLVAPAAARRAQRLAGKEEFQARRALGGDAGHAGRVPGGG